jgi:hypothetical protein
VALDLTALADVVRAVRQSAGTPPEAFATVCDLDTGRWWVLEFRGDGADLHDVEGDDDPALADLTTDSP